MIQANELRIGNLVYENGDIFEITSITRNGQLRLFSALENHSSGISKIKPIPLTEKWLVRFGFKVKMGSVTHNHSFIKNDFLLNNGLRSGISYDGIELKYVHQLQNLYFALTGKELEITNSNKSS